MTDRAAYADAEPRPLWWEAVRAADAQPPLAGVADADLCIVGAGFTGLWAALHAKADDPTRDVVLLEAETAGYGASGRNGGIVSSPLAHGIANGLARCADEMPVLERMAAENFDGFVRDLSAHAIDCDLVAGGRLTVALEPHQDAWLEEQAELARRFGHDVELLDGEAARAQVRSPTYRAALWQRNHTGVLHPGKLAAGLRAAAVRAGVRMHEHTPVTALEAAGGGITVLAPQGRVRARRVLLATNAFPPLLRRIRHYVVPVYDYVLATEPLGAEQWEAIGWQRRQAITDLGSDFHYYRPTADGRIVFGGGVQLVYRFGGPVAPRLDEYERSFATLARHFFATFPQLRGARFTHRWGGPIDVCSRYAAFYGTAHEGRVAYAVGYSGLGVGATRFGARVALDLLDGRDTEATRLRYVRSRPTPFPPEPLRSAVIHLTQNRLAAADRHAGRRGLWLRTLDRLGLGFEA